MNKEDKELLLKDLSTRLPYGVICQVTFDEDNIFTETLESVNMKYINQISTSGSSCGVECIKPYLRPMSSMKEDEIKELGIIDRKRLIFSARHLTYHLDGEIIDFLNKKMIDWRGLIEKDLAIKAPKGMYKFK